MTRKTQTEPARRLRCAVYTRKSSEEGLDMEFNSLDAQREACEAYIASQRAEGWACLRERYDDGGFSGGTLERCTSCCTPASIAAKSPTRTRFIPVCTNPSSTGSFGTPPLWCWQRTA